MSNWCRLYGDMVHNPKIGKLSDAEFRLYISLLCLATNANELSEDNDGNTKHTAEEAAWVLRCNVTETLQKLIETNLVTISETKTIQISGWDKHQKKSDSSTARVQKYRQNKALKNETLQKRYSNGLEREKELELETELENIHDPNGSCSFSDKTENQREDQLEVSDRTKKRHTPHVPYKEIVNLYHEVLPMCPENLVMNEERKGYIRARWKEGYDDLSLWRQFFERVAESDFLTGKSESREGRKPFVASLDWLVRPRNWAKVLENRYE